MRAALRPFGLTHVQFVLLATLAWAQHDEPITQRWLADRARTDPMMTSQVLRALEAKGLVERTAHPSDARARALRASATGLALVNEANAAVEAVDAQYFAVLGPDGADFTRMLRRLAAQQLS